MTEDAPELLRGNRFDPEYLPKFEGKLFFEGTRRERQLLNFVVLLALATVIATYGVITDSTATVIGAMIIAPLMTPIMASAAALTMQASARLLKALILVTAGVLGVIVLSMVLTAIVPSELISLSSNSQITSRISPGLLDLFVAVAAGAAGAFAIGREEIADSLAGVAIAISLVPPLAVVGISLVKGSIPDASGAFLLFLTNFIAILIAGVIVFHLMRIPQSARERMAKTTHHRAIGVVIVAAILLIAVLTFTTYNVYQTANEQIQVKNSATSWLANSQYRVTSVTVNGNLLAITLLGSGPIPPVDSLASDIEKKLGHPVLIDLQVVPEQHLNYPTTSNVMKTLSLS